MRSYNLFTQADQLRLNVALPTAAPVPVIARYHYYVGAYTHSTFYDFFFAFSISATVVTVSYIIPGVSYRMPL